MHLNRQKLREGVLIFNFTRICQVCVHLENLILKSSKKSIQKERISHFFNFIHKVSKNLTDSIDAAAFFTIRSSFHFYYEQHSKTNRPYNGNKTE